MEKLKLLKKDFVKKDVKSICNYSLPSGKAYFMENNIGSIQYGSDDYVRKNFSLDEIRHVVDFTKGLIANFEHGVTNTKKATTLNKKTSLKPSNTGHKNSLLYLLLSEEKMKHFTGFSKVKNKFLSELYSFYIKKNSLSEKQVASILQIEKKQSEYINKYNCHILSLKNLQTCYAYEYKIKRAIECLNEKYSSYMKSMLQNLYENLYLTDKQITGIRKWFVHLENDLKETKLESFDVEK